MPLLYGIHDREGRHIVPPDGWCVDVLALSENPPPADYNALRGDINWIVRFQWGFGTTGTIPLPKDDNLYFDRLAHYVHNSKGAHIWIIGNEVQHEQERPDGVFITPQRYADFFLRARTLIKVINSSHQVLPSPMAPYHANPVDWLAYWHDMLRIIEGNGGCDGIAVHAYTRSSNPDDINDDARMGPPLEDQCSGFLTYQDALEEVPATLRHLPAYITEFNELLDGGWDDRNTGVVQEAYSHINWWNTHAADANDLKVQCLILYRWPKFDKWHIEGKNGVIDDFRAAVARGYTSPVQGKEQMTTHIPVVTPGSPPAEPSLPPRQIDQRLLDRDTKVMDAKVQPGMEYWRLVRARWFDEQESQGRHHIYVETLDEQGKPVADVLFVVAWPSGSTESRTKGGLGFDAGNVPMSPGRNSFTVSVPLSDLVTGIGMGQDYPDGFNAGVHTSTLLTYQLATVPAATVPTPPPIVSPGPQPVPPPVEWDVMWIVTTVAANIRKHPSLDAQVLKVFPQGTRLKAVGEVGEWYQAVGGGADAFMVSEVFYVHKSVAQPVADKPPVQPPAQEDTWSRAWPIVLKIEGGLSLDPNDTGNYYQGRLIGTKFGISAAVWGGQYDIPNLTKEQALSIYKTAYWDAANCEALPWPMCLIVFDTAINHGVGVAQKLLNHKPSPEEIYMGLRLLRYVEDPKWKHFGVAWGNRVEHLDDIVDGEIPA